MSNKLRYLAAFVLVALILAVSAWRYTFRRTETSVQAVKSAYTLDVQELLRAFENNEDSANVLYLDKIIVVTGMVGEIMSDSLGYTVYLKDSDALSGILCSFSMDALDTTLVIPGSQVSVKGICTGYLLDVNLNRCALIETAAN